MKVNKTIYIYGASGHGLVVADIAKACGYSDTIFIDDAPNKFPTFEEIKNNNHTPIALGIGDNYTRKKLFEKVMKYHFEVVSLIYPNAIIASNVSLGKGSVIMPHVVVNSYSKIGCGVILNSSSVIEHENSIGDFAHISPNASLAGNVTIGDMTHIGIGSTIIQGITIGKNSMIGAGSVVVRDIADDLLCYGNPSKVIRKLNEK